MADKHLYLEQRCQQFLQETEFVTSDEHSSSCQLLTQYPQAIFKIELPVLEPVEVPQFSLAENWVSEGKDQKWSNWPQANATGYTCTRKFNICSVCDTIENITLTYAKTYAILEEYVCISLY